MPPRPFVWMLLLACALPVAARAQGGGGEEGDARIARAMHLAAANQLGVLEYCQARGAVGADVLDLQRRMEAAMPPLDVPGASAAEAAGRKGLVGVGGQQTSLRDAARAQKTSEDAICKHMASMLEEFARNPPQ